MIPSSFIAMAIPEFMRGHTPLVGIGHGCIDGYDFDKRSTDTHEAVAHAHILGSHVGWICCNPKLPPADPMSLLHELAHLYTKQGHTKKWKRRYLSLAFSFSEEIGLAALNEIMHSYTSRPYRMPETQRLRDLVGPDLPCPEIWVVWSPPKPKPPKAESRMCGAPDGPLLFIVDEAHDLPEGLLQ